ncbi:MAG: leucyl aminopeptidase family protein [Steroidobacteraceae bacterium]
MLSEFLSPDRAGAARPLWLLAEASLEPWLAEQPPAVQAWVRQNGFRAERSRVLPLPSAAGGVSGAVVGLGPLLSLDQLTIWHAAGLPAKLGPGAYALAEPLPVHAATQFALGWQLGSYRYARYRSPAAVPSESAQLVAPQGADVAYAMLAAAACTHARDWINSPANDFGPAELADAAAQLALRFDAECQITVGDDLRAAGYPLVYEVGKASVRQPRLIDLRAGAANAPRVTIVGKGVCFDSGGLDLKPSAAMLLMKKDMGGAACALALAEMLLAGGASIRLRVLIPAVENAVGGRAFRPGDVLRSRKGCTVEIGNTDAEGRLILADALAAAEEDDPALLIDLATLTGAARVALGPELPAVYSQPESLAEQLRDVGQRECDPVWPMPLWAGYEDDLASKLADCNNVSSSTFAGSIIGALFLRKFVSPARNWLHVDLYGWNAKDRPGRPVGAEAQCVRALYQLIRHRYG